MLKVMGSKQEVEKPEDLKLEFLSYVKDEEEFNSFFEKERHDIHSYLWDWKHIFLSTEQDVPVQYWFKAEGNKGKAWICLVPKPESQELIKAMSQILSPELLEQISNKMPK